jgi:translation initiation factor 2B subunit (eIF-2B alpha/beta/delta family)
MVFLRAGHTDRLATRKTTTMTIKNYTHEFDNDATEAVENAIGKSQDENRVIKIGDSKAVRSVLSQKCDDNCDGDGGCYWGENKHGSWCVCVRIGVES